jgi:3'-5' exoribonuclease
MDQFMIAPAGEYYHGAFRGALFLHTLGVVKNIVSMIDVYCNPGFREKPKLNTDLLITSAYLHDIGKLDEYEYEIFVRRKKDILEDHISMGATYISVINKETKLLSPEDEKSLRYMILSSHGEFSPYKPKSLEDHLLSQADMIDTKVNQFIENVKT